MMIKYSMREVKWSCNVGQLSFGPMISADWCAAKMALFVRVVC